MRNLCGASCRDETRSLGGRKLGSITLFIVDAERGFVLCLDSTPATQWGLWHWACTQRGESVLRAGACKGCGALAPQSGQKRHAPIHSQSQSRGQAAAVETAPTPTKLLCSGSRSTQADIAPRTHSVARGFSRRALRGVRWAKRGFDYSACPERSEGLRAFRSAPDDNLPLGERPERRAEPAVEGRTNVAYGEHGTTGPSAFTEARPLNEGLRVKRAVSPERPGVALALSEPERREPKRHQGALASK